MGATRLQMQNFLIFLLDLVGVTVGILQQYGCGLEILKQGIP